MDGYFRQWTKTTTKTWALEPLQDETTVVSTTSGTQLLREKLEKEVAQLKRGFEKQHHLDASPSSSRPPTPPDSGTTTPRLRIVCPPRWQPLIPPPNYGAVQAKSMYRSSFPQDRNMDFIKSLKPEIRSVLTLVDTEPPALFKEWIEEKNIKHKTLVLATNKDGAVNTTMDSLCKALAFILKAENRPVYIHCNQGKHRTGCLVACVRKIQGWDVEDIIEEYRTYAGVKARDGDIKLIRHFDPEILAAYARRVRRIDSATDAGYHLAKITEDIREELDEFEQAMVVEQRTVKVR